MNKHTSSDEQKKLGYRLVDKYLEAGGDPEMIITSQKDFDRNFKAHISKHYIPRMGGGKTPITPNTDGCPCLVVEPCMSQCTCARPLMSGGCLRCAKYGNQEQRLQAAQRLSAGAGAATAHSKGESLNLEGEK